MNWRLGDVSDVGRFGVTVYAVRVPGCLRSVGVVVIVVGNYFVAAFNEASGASTCNPGFQHPRRNQCAPMRDFPSRGNRRSWKEALPVSFKYSHVSVVCKEWLPEEKIGGQTKKGKFSVDIS